MNNPHLVRRMRERADEDGLETDHELRLLAAEFEEVSAGFFQEPQAVAVQRYTKAWLQARMAWCRYSGESLA